MAAACSSVFGVRALLTGLLSPDEKEIFLLFILLSLVIFSGVLVLQYIFVAAVKKTSDRYLLTLTELEREE